MPPGRSLARSSYCCGQDRTDSEITTTLARLLRKHIAPTTLNQHRVGISATVFSDTRMLEKLFGIQPAQELEAGMAQLIEGGQTVTRPQNCAQQSLAELAGGGLVA